MNPQTTSRKNRYDQSRKKGPVSTEHFSTNTLQTGYLNQLDDLIAALATAYENRRARQVNKWERMTAPRITLM
ncbi:MAG: hypothetical protein WKF34_04965 [Pyrinomonadaceae bacterium]